MSASSRARWAAAAALYLGLTLAYCRTLLPVLGSALPNDTGDPGLNAWILWWNAHALPLTERWWNAPIFFPAQGVMALSETFLNLWPLSTPLQWLGLSPVLTYNLMFLLSFPAAALAAHALARRLTGRHDAALIAGLAFGFAPYRAAQMSHLQALWSCWMPLGLLCLHRFLDDRRPRNLIAFAVCWVMNGLATGYFLFFFAALVGLWLLWFGRTVRDWLSVGLAASAGSAALAPVLYGYQHYQTLLGLTRTASEIEFYSADLSAIWAAHEYVLSHAWTFNPKVEGELYPGVFAMVLMVEGAIVSWRRTPKVWSSRVRPWLFGLAGLIGVATLYAWRTGGWSYSLGFIKLSFTHPIKTAFPTVGLALLALGWDSRVAQAVRARSALMFYCCAAAMMFVFTLGPQAKAFGALFWAQAPYFWLMQLPGGHALRVPARFSMLLALCVAVAASVAFARLTAGNLRRGAVTWALAAVCAGVLVDGFVWKMGVAPVPTSISTSGIPRDAVVLELPIGDTYGETTAMLRQTHADYRLVNGFSGYLPSSYMAVKSGLEHFDASVIETLQQFGPLTVLVKRQDDTNNRYYDFIFNRPDSRRVLTDASGALFQFPARSLEASAPSRALRVASVRASAAGRFAANMLDGDLTTRWETQRPQKEGDEVVITMAEPVTVTRIELDIAAFNDNFPRRMRITSLQEDGSRPVVWEGGGGGAAVTANLRDRARLPLVLDLKRHLRTRELVLTLTEGDENFDWSIAELAVFGQ